MKKLILLFLLVFPLQDYGQEHLTFLDLSITGDMKTFVKALERKGFSKEMGKGWFHGMKTKYLRGDFWMFPDCDVVVRQPKKYQYVTSVYVHPKNNFLLLNRLIGVLDQKYGSHIVSTSDVDVNALTYIWDTPEGAIEIFGTVVYGQGFDILYRDHVEVKMLNHVISVIDNDL